MSFLFNIFKNKSDSLLWKDWNYNVGHNELIEDKYNSDIIALMNPLCKEVEKNIIMIYDLSSNENVTKVNDVYYVKSGEYEVYNINIINIS